MLYIPPTSKEVYVSSIVALNIHSPQGTGDWHSSYVLRDNAFDDMGVYIYGEKQAHNTNKLLGNLGIIDGTERLNKMGYYPKNSPTYIADHPRACVDYLYMAVLKTGSLGRVMLDEWFPGIEDKKSVYELLEIMRPKLNDLERENLDKWIARNPIIE
ncbi:hypothetical protein [Helicobacter cetorum]|uniref:Uncharacterized protein n=1 Tax=Helicobacter cetorum (strain ATCC BAA-429 / MIT 00-7128) TaxID=182217 RepID=I0ENY4_HELC0|nr:hypothetical protein [Helicobacter cetorum]AFI04653.1 hypothetical protein HCW_06975 [Helicobacter cetorum MIT 00-7128]